MEVGELEEGNVPSGQESNGSELHDDDDDDDESGCGCMYRSLVSE
jgi:hypothetical protein